MIQTEKLQKVMARCGCGSRRECEEYIKQGKVSVNGQVITQLGTRVSPKDNITYNGKSLEKEELVYFLLHKPTGYVTTTKDEFDRRTVVSLIDDKDTKNKRIYPVGRLDYDTSGAIILTNDGELTAKLIKSQNDVPKEYLVTVNGIVKLQDVITLSKGVLIDNVMTKKAEVSLISVNQKSNSSVVRIVITEGRNRQVRKMFETLNFKVKKLKRLSFCNLNVENLKPGEYRSLKIHEVKVLHSYNKSK